MFPTSGVPNVDYVLSSPRENPTAWYSALFDVTHGSCLKICILQWPASVGNPKSLVSQQHGSAVRLYTAKPTEKNEQYSYILIKNVHIRLFA